MLSQQQIFFTFVFPAIALFIPLGVFLYRKYKYNLVITIDRRTLTRFLFTWFSLGVLLFILLLYLSSGINFFVQLEKGIFISIWQIDWNITEHLRITFVYNPGIGLIVVSVLSGLLYSSLLTLPKVCTINTTLSQTSKDSGGAGGSASSSVASGVSGFSAVASSAVCCTTSSLAIIAPSISVFLGPYVPFLMLFSFLLLIYAFYVVVMPKFPRVSEGITDVPVLI